MSSEPYLGFFQKRKFREIFYLAFIFPVIYVIFFFILTLRVRLHGRNSDDAEIQHCLEFKIIFQFSLFS